jgi:hypothetical protein
LYIRGNKSKGALIMLSRNLKMRFSLLLVLALMVGAVSLWGASAVIGSVAGSTNATVGGQALVPNTTLFSGDNLRVSDGAAVVAMGMGSRMVFGRDTVASFERGPEEVTVLLGQGSVSMYHPEAGVALRVKAGDIAVSSGKGFKTLGEVAMLNGAVVVTAKEGTLRVDGAGRTTEVTKGKTIAIMQKPAAGTPQGGGRASSHWTQSQVVSVVTLAAAGVGMGFSIANYQKTKDVQTTANTAAANAAQADADAKAATAAANQADADAKLALSAALAAQQAANDACHQVSPDDPHCH